MSFTGVVLQVGLPPIGETMRACLRLEDPVSGLFQTEPVSQRLGTMKCQKQ